MAYQSNAVTKVYDFILEKIKQGDWPKDTKIWPELKLAEQLAVSRIAVRDAIQKLSAMSVLRKVQGSGTYVNNVSLTEIISSLMPIMDISKKELLDIMEFRSFFEYGNVQMFIRNATPKHLEKLEQDYEQMVENIHNAKAFHDADFAFHNDITYGSGNLFSIRINEFYVDIFKKYQKFLSDRLGPQIGIEDHGQILKYIKQKDEQLASLHMKRHIEHTLNAMKQYLKEQEGIEIE